MLAPVGNHLIFGRAAVPHMPPGAVVNQLVNDTPLGRSVDEALRMIDALQYFEDNGEVCPADWKPGKKAMKETHEAVAAYLSEASF